MDKSVDRVVDMWISPVDTVEGVDKCWGKTGLVKRISEKKQSSNRNYIRRVKRIRKTKSAAAT